MNVSLYQCFEADRRISMSVYGDGLVDALNSISYTVKSFVPSSDLEKFKDRALIMRYLRYYAYSRQVKKSMVDDGQIHHVIDHGYAHLYPSFAGKKSCISVHDLIPLLTWKGLITPEKNNGSFDFHKPWLNLFSLRFIDKFDQIISVSQSTANDLQTYLNIDPEKISVIPPVINHSFQPVDEKIKNRFRQMYQFDESIKWIMISGAEYYKNNRTSLLVLKSLLKNVDYPVKLIKTGQKSEEFDQLVDELGLSENVVQFFFQDIDDLPILYNVVDCLLFPSLYEGFGMPVVEALSCGTPVVMSNRGSLPEVGGSFAVQHDCFDIEGMSKSIYQIFKNKEMILNIYNQAPNWCEQFRAFNVGRMLNQTYNRI